MLFASEIERAFAGAVAELVYGNPFLPERIDAERAALGPDFDPAGTLWHTRDEPERTPNVVRIGERVVALAEDLRGRLGRGARATRPTPETLGLYEDLVVSLLYDRYQANFFELVHALGAATRRVAFYEAFRGDLAHFLGGPAAALPATREAAHLFACFFQVRRAFHHTYAHILGASAPATRLRAAVWQSVFTGDPRRYRRSLAVRMGDIPTLITGPSGTGKELVARAIGLARYIPFDERTQAFAQDPAEGFFPLHLSALSPPLIEAELFGHRRGAFTGALQDRKGWFEVCPPLGTVFLDEIGDVDPAIQVKLLRVLHTRTFQRLGETEARRFEGKVIAATNRDLAAEMAAGRFREDFYYRLCADQIVTPSLAERLREDPNELRVLLLAIARRVAGEAEAEGLADEAEGWIRTHLGPDYPWPGNVRELEQCVRNVLIRGEYRPRQAEAATTTARSELVQAVLGGALTAEELLRRYCTLVYAQTGSYLETAHRLGLDRRTVRTKVDPGWLAAFRAEAGAPTDAGPAGRRRARRR